MWTLHSTLPLFLYMLPTLLQRDLLPGKSLKPSLNPVSCWDILTWWMTLKIDGASWAKQLETIILPEEKGFIKDRFMLDAIITFWESFEYAKESEQHFMFFKIDFDKAYDRIEWDFIFRSLHDIVGKQFIKFILVLFGNALAKVAVNGELTGCISLKRSIRQGCPIAPSLFVIDSNAP
ncbi:hypothetical protein L7F22_002399 [Adiantum nelumboides]|nr:hypothetical protein [Adiantum nelumboides]